MNESAYKGQHDPINAPINQPIKSEQPQIWGKTMKWLEKLSKECEQPQEPKGPPHPDYPLIKEEHVKYIHFEQPQEWTCKDGAVYPATNEGWPMRHKEHALEVVVAHNAALADEVVKRRELCVQAVKDVEALNVSHDALEQQLSKERERTENLRRMLRESEALTQRAQDGWENCMGIRKDWQEFGSKLSKFLDGVTTDEWLESAKQLKQQLAALEIAIGERSDERDQLAKKLAAEQEKVENLHKILGHKREMIKAERETKEKAIEAWGNRNLKLAEQLAAEENEHGRIQANIAMQVQELTHKLAVEREAAQKLCEIYFNIAEEAVGEDEVRRKRDEAMAKVVNLK